MSEPRLGIVHAIARLNVGGAAASTLQLAAEQQRQGHDVVVVHGRLAAGEESMAYLADELGIRTVHLPALQRELSPRRDAEAILGLRRIVRERRPDVFHTHTAKAGATGRLAALSAGRDRPPAVIHQFHGHVLRGYFPPGRERLFRWVERVLARSTGALIAVSDEVRDELVAMNVAPREQFAVIPYGFDLDGLDEDAGARKRVRDELGARDDTFVVGWVGRLTPIKRPRDLVRTLQRLLEHDVDTMFVVVGDGAERAEVEALSRELGVADRLRLVGFQRALRDWYSAFDAVLLTSENEGTPVVAIEALAARRPVVATTAGGTATVVTHGRSGFLAPIGDTAALAGRLAQLAADPELRRAFGHAGGEDVRARFATSRMTADVATLYRLVLGR
jgi:glycosyltransferase involved in cell wall biosynthesis